MDIAAGAWGLIALLWLVGLIVYFRRTTERTRESHLALVWGLLLVPIVIEGIRLVLSL